MRLATLNHGIRVLLVFGLAAVNPLVQAQHEPARYPAGHPLAGQSSQTSPSEQQAPVPAPQAEPDVPPPAAVEPALPEAPANAAKPSLPPHDTVVAMVETSALLYRDLGDRCGVRVVPGAPLDNQLVTYARTFICRMPYINRESRMSEVYYRGSRYYIPRESLFVPKSDDTSRNDALTDEQAAQLYEQFSQDSRDLHSIELKGAFKALDKTKKDGLALLERSVYDESEHTQGTGFAVEVVNTSKKTIKYVVFSVVGYNAVGDPVRERVRGTTSLTLRGVGPIEPMESGKYTFEYAWHTDLVESARIRQIRLDFMDGTSKTLASPDPRLKLPDNVLAALNAPEAP